MRRLRCAKALLRYVVRALLRLEILHLFQSKWCFLYSIFNATPHTATVVFNYAVSTADQREIGSVKKAPSEDRV